MLLMFFFLFKQKTAYEMRISDWSSDVCSSDLRKGRLQTEGQADYSILDGEQMATHVVMQEDRTIMTMDPAKLAAAGVANSKNTEPMGQGEKKMGEREIRGVDTTGYRIEFMGNIATVWLSEDHDAQTGEFFDIWSPRTEERR